MRAGPHLAGEGERLLSDGLRVADVAQHDVGERARLAVRQGLDVRLQAAEHAARASGLRALWLCTSGRERAAAGPGGGEAGSWGRTMALMTS